MALDSYTNLVAAIGSWLGRSDLAAQIDDAIVLFEGEVNRDLRVLDMMASTTLTTTGGTTSYATPADFLELYGLEGQSFPRSVEFLTVSALISRFNNYDTGAPRAFAIDTGNQLKFAPIPDSTYTFTERYYAKVPPLASNGTNWLLQKAPSAYLFGALSYLQAYVVDNDQFAVFKGQKMEALNSLREADSRQRLSGPSLRPQTQGMTP